MKINKLALSLALSLVLTITFAENSIDCNYDPSGVCCSDALQMNNVIKSNGYITTTSYDSVTELSANAIPIQDANTCSADCISYEYHHNVCHWTLGDWLHTLTSGN